VSRILELPPTDEQTVVARVLLELHQAIDTNFPNVNASSRQFTKTVLANQGERTAVDNQPMQQVANAKPASPSQPSAQSKNSIHQRPTQAPPPRNLEFSSNVKTLGNNSPQTLLNESLWSRWLTRILVLTFIAGCIMFAWIYLFGV
jgi:hypothetical protein